jgi:hypothetical protein
MVSVEDNLLFKNWNAYKSLRIKLQFLLQRGAAG